MWDNWVEDGAPVTACGIAGAATGGVDAFIAHAGPELTFHLSALGAVAGVLLGAAVAFTADRLGRRRLGRRVLRDGPLVASTTLPLLFMAYAYHRGLALDALEPRLFLLPAFFLVGARTLHAALSWASSANEELSSRLIVVAWAGLATAFVLTGHGLATRPEFVVRAVQESELGGTLLAAARRSPLLDSDGDGYPVALCAAECDCDDADPGVNPAAREAAGDGVDQDCSGADLTAPPDTTPLPVQVAAAVLGTQEAQAASVRRASDVLPGLGDFIGLPEVLDPLDPHVPPPPSHDPDRQPDLLLITVDTLRADHLGCYGYSRDTSPFIDGLAESGTLFQQARSQGSMTAWSMSSMATGRYFTELSRTDSKWPRVRAPGPHLGERLASAGYHTVGVLPQFFFYKRYGLGRGFKVWDTSTVRARRPFHQKVTGDMITDLAVAELRRLPEDRPTLMWLHYGDPHSDYLHHPGVSTFGRSRVGRYDGEIRFTDIQIEKITQAWQALDRDRPLVGLLTSDHGENLVREDDHGALYHGSHLYDTLIRVPMIVWGDGVQARHVQRPVGLIDVLPTLLELAGMPGDSTLSGRSLVPWLRGREVPARPIFSEKPRPAAKALKAMVDWPYKLIWHQAVNQYSVFDLQSDPGERDDLFGQAPSRDAALVERMVRWRTLDLASIPPREE